MELDMIYEMILQWFARIYNIKNSSLFDIETFLYMYIKSQQKIW